VLPLANYGAVAKIDLTMGPDPAKRDVTLDPGWTFTGTVLGQDGKPLGGTRGFGLGGWDHRQVMQEGEFTVSGFNPHRPHDIFFQHLEKGLVGIAQPPKENGGAITVRMQPGAAVTGRLVDANGRPRRGVELELRFHQKDRQISWAHYSGEPIKTDSQGRFRIKSLLAGWEFRLSDDKGEFSFADLRSGQTKDLGDLRMNKTEK